MVGNTSNRIGKPCKIKLVNLYLGLKTHLLPFSRGIIKNARQTYTHAPAMCGGTVKSAACTSNVANVTIGNKNEILVLGYYVSSPPLSLKTRSAIFSGASTYLLLQGRGKA